MRAGTVYVAGMLRLVPATVLASALLAAPAHGAGSVTPISPKAGDAVPAGKRPTFKVAVTGRHTGVFVHVCKSKRRDRDGIICNDEALGRAKRKARGRYEYKAEYFDLPDSWLNNPGTYYWQAYRTWCDDGLDDCKSEGPVVKFRVA
jgi:hypothetical protein